MQTYLSLALFFIYLWQMSKLKQIQKLKLQFLSQLLVHLALQLLLLFIKALQQEEQPCIYKYIVFKQIQGFKINFCGNIGLHSHQNGTLGLSIICISSVKPDDHSVGSLSIVTKVTGSADSTCNAVVYCYFTYLKSLTSQLNFLILRVNYPSQWSVFGGKILVDPLSSAQLQIQIENEICDRSQSLARLKEIVQAGSSSITVTDTTDLQIGDWIVISLKGGNPDEHEKVEMTQIVGTTVIFSVSLKYSHIGVFYSTLLTLNHCFTFGQNYQISGAS